MIDYDDLEDVLMSGQVRTKQSFWAYAGLPDWRTTRKQRDKVRAGLFSGARAILAGLPNSDPRSALEAAAKLTDEQVVKIRDMYAQGLWTQQDLATEFCVGRSTVAEILTHRTWKNV